MPWIFRSLESSLEHAPGPKIILCRESENETVLFFLRKIGPELQSGLPYRDNPERFDNFLSMESGFRLRDRSWRVTCRVAPRVADHTD